MGSRIHVCTVISLTMLWAGLPAYGQTVSNPDVSFIVDTRGVYRTDETARGLGIRNARFEFAEAELDFAAYLNPYMRGDVALGMHGVEGPVEVEEASLTILRGLPFSLQVETGRYFLDFGRINQQHPHQWAWIERPLMHRTLLTDEGLGVDGLNISTLQALGDNAVTVTVNAFGGGAFSGHGEEHGFGETGEGEVAETDERIAYSGRLSVFRELTEATNAELGASWLAGEYDAAEGLDVIMGMLDLKVKWRPDKYRSIDWVLEAGVSSRDVLSEAEDSTASPVVEEVEAAGVFSALQIRFRRLWDVGGFVDRTESATVDGAVMSAFGFFAGYMPAEETARISVVFRHETSDLLDFDDTSLTLQFLWALGPHRPHQF